MEEPAAKDMRQPTERNIAVPSEKGAEETAEMDTETKVEEPSEKSIEETTKITMVEEGLSSPSSSLTTLLPLAALASVLAVLSGILLYNSSFFGGTLVVVFACSLIYAVYRIATVKPLIIKNFEVQLLGLCVPLLVALSAMSAVPEIMQYPAATNALNLLQISAVWMHLALLKRTSERMNQYVLLGYSITLIVASVIGTGYIWGRWGWEPPVFGFPYGFPSCLAIVYAMVPLIYSTFQLRDKLPISMMETAALITSLLGVASCIAAYFYSPALLPGSILATVVCFVLYVRLDHLEHKMRIPQELWTDDTEIRSNCHVTIKVLLVWTVACWTGMGAIGSWAIKADIAERVAACGTPYFANCRQGQRVFAVALFAFLAANGHVCMFDTVRMMRKKESPLLDGQNFNRNSFYALAAIAAILLIKVAIACFFLFCPHATVPAWVATTIVGSLYLLVSLLLDRMRAALLPYNIKLLLVSIGLGVYLFATGVYLSETHSEDDPRAFLGVFLTGVLVCTLLAIHFGMAIAEQFKKKRKYKKNPAYFSRGQSEDISTA